MKKLISFKVSKADAVLIGIAARRANRIAREAVAPGIYTVLDAEMDLTACHANGCKLDLPALLATTDGHFAHDVFGIRRHLERRDGLKTSGQLGGFFTPRFKAKP